jgi:hypothetical protein
MAYFNYAAIQNTVSGDGIISCTNFNGGSSTLTIELDVGIFNRPGRYVVVKSTNAITNPPTGYAVSFVGGTSLLNVKSAARETVPFSTGAFDCITVTIG